MGMGESEGEVASGRGREEGTMMLVLIGMVRAVLSRTKPSRPPEGWKGQVERGG